MVPRAAGDLTELTRLVSGVTVGAPTVAIITGPAGSGRTRLLEQFVQYAQRRGLAPVRESDWISLAAARRLAASRTGHRPAVTVLVCDFPNSLDGRIWPVLHDLARRTPVLVVLTWRAGDQPLPLHDLTSARVHRIRVAPLTAAEVTDMATAMLGAPPSPGVRSLARIAAGNPATAEDLFAGLREENLVRVVAGHAELIAVRLPARTRTRLAGRLASLHPPARHLLQLAALLDPPFRMTDLVQRQGGTVAGLLPVIDEVLGSGLLRAERDTLAFSHELVRSLVEASIPHAVLAALREEAPPRPARRPVTRAPRAAHPKPARPDPARPEPARPEVADEGWERLNERERHISWLVGRALTNRQIATRIGRSPHTVNYHLRRIFQQLGIGSRVELAAVAQRHEQVLAAAAPAGAPPQPGPHSSARPAAQP